MPESRALGATGRQVRSCGVAPAFFLALVLVLVPFTCYPDSGKGVEWERFRFWPKVTLSEEYSDNFFLTSKNSKDEYITTISPAFGIDFAIAPQNIVSLTYEGDYRYFAHFGNVRNDYHQPSLTWLWTQPRGSFIKIQAKQDYNAYRPTSETDDLNRDYVLTTISAQSLLKVGTYMEADLNYSHDTRSFDSADFAIDEFDRDSFSIALGYARFNFGTLLLQYSFTTQDNNDIVGPSTDFITHTAMFGVKWDPERRLSGSLKMGYLQSRFEEGDSYGGYSLDCDLSYRLTDITQLKLRGWSFVTRSTMAARETGNFFVETGVKISAVYHMSELLTVAPDFSFVNRDFNVTNLFQESRIDRLYEAGIEIRYPFRDWLSVSVRYHFKRNDSSEPLQAFTENAISLRLTASM